MYTNKRKIINDPIYGFVTIPGDLIYDLINHPYFQRLRRIKQLGLTNLVYPGALHTRFHHAIGAMHLMQEAVLTLRYKNIAITAEEEQAVLIAILLHDIGHGPFSHALEHSIVKGISHENISSLLMDKLNQEFGGQLSLDMDRLDYLKRDSFFTGVSEGVISSDRIIKMLNVVENKLVVEHKAIYSIEKFLIARRLMYWQVYLHKTVLSAETLLVNILKRAKELSAKDLELFGTPTLLLFLKNNFTQADFERNSHLLHEFSKLDDSDVDAAIKVWSDNEDPILSRLCQNLLDRKLFKIEIRNEAFPEEYVRDFILKVCEAYQISRDEAAYFVITDSVNNSAYNASQFSINILMNNRQLIDVAEASDQLNIQSLSKTVTKYYLCYPKELAR
jgi:HD superfamily phosphohydrolase